MRLTCDAPRRVDAVVNGSVLVSRSFECASALDDVLRVWRRTTLCSLASRSMMEVMSPRERNGDG